MCDFASFELFCKRQVVYIIIIHTFKPFHPRHSWLLARVEHHQLMIACRLNVRTCTLSFYLFSFYYSILTLKISKRLAMFLRFCCVVTYPVLVWLLTHVSCITSASCSLLFLILTSLSTSLLVAFVLKARD